MREITDIDMYELSKAAARIPTYTRSLDKDGVGTEPSVDPGHFSCMCGVGPLSLTRYYTTFYVHDSFADSAEDGFICSFVISYQDNFFMNNPTHLFANIRRDTLSDFGHPYDSWIGPEDLEGNNGSFYVRILYDGIEEKHINATFNFKEYLENSPSLEGIVIRQVPSWNVTGVYADPRNKNYKYDLSTFHASSLMPLTSLSVKVGVPVAGKLQLTVVKPITQAKKASPPPLTAKQSYTEIVQQAMAGIDVSAWTSAFTTEQVIAAVNEPSSDGPVEDPGPWIAFATGDNE